MYIILCVCVCVAAQHESLMDFVSKASDTGAVVLGLHSLFSPSSSTSTPWPPRPSGVAYVPSRGSQHPGSDLPPPGLFTLLTQGWHRSHKTLTFM